MRYSETRARISVAGRRDRSPLAREIFDVDSANHVQLLVVERNLDAQ